MLRRRNLARPDVILNSKKISNYILSSGVIAIVVGGTQRLSARAGKQYLLRYVNIGSKPRLGLRSREVDVDVAHANGISPRDAAIR